MASFRVRAERIGLTVERERYAGQITFTLWEGLDCLFVGDIQGMLSFLDGAEYVVRSATRLVEPETLETFSDAKYTSRQIVVKQVDPVEWNNLTHDE